MTLATIAAFVCSRLNQSDATSTSLCKQFANRRYQMIYEQRNWRDALANVSEDLTDTVTGLMQIPSGIDRILAIRCNGDHILHPVDSPQVMQLDPTIFERAGVPIAYEEFSVVEFQSDSLNIPSPIVQVQKIRFFPLPDQTYTMLITGKKPFVELVDNDSPLLRGILNTLIAFTTADMLERARQYGKSQAKVQEATALLEQMIEADTNASGHMPRVIPSVEYEMTQDRLAGCGNDWLYRV